MTELFSDAMRRNPYPLYEQLRKNSPVFQDPQSGVWMLFDYNTVKGAVSNHEAFSNRAMPPGATGEPLRWLIFKDPPRHAKLRAIIMNAFTPSVVANLEPRIRELSRTLLNQSVERGEMELVADYSAPLPIMVIADMLGVPNEDRQLLRGWSDAILGLSHTVMGGGAVVEALNSYGAASAEMQIYLTELLDHRQAAPTEDLLSRLVHAEVDGERLSADEIFGFFQLLLLAGSETTTNLISNAIICLLDHPDQLDRVREHVDLIPSAIEEVLRYRSPVQAVFRQSQRDIEVGGAVIPTGKLVLPMIGSANRDSQVFADADRFNVTRDPNPHIAFGHGIHFCIGASLSRLEGRIALADLLQRLRALKHSSNEPWEPRDAFHIHGPSRLPIRFEPAHKT
jgi:cytochrome P450